jgi:chloramphenicol O-acetyltransferase type B
VPHPASQTTPPVTIGNDVWIGHNAVVLEGIKIDDGAAIGAAAVVTKSVPSYAIVAGIPAVVKRYRFSPEIIARLLKVQWWDLRMQALDGLPFNDISQCLDRLEKFRST